MNKTRFANHICCMCKYAAHICFSYDCLTVQLLQIAFHTGHMFHTPPYEITCGYQKIFVISYFATYGALKLCFQMSCGMV